MSNMTRKLNVGDVVAGHLEVVTVMEGSPLGNNYLLRDTNTSARYIAKQLSFPCDSLLSTEIGNCIDELKKISHKSISTLHDFVVDGEVGYILMEFIDGETLASHLKSRRERGQLIGIKPAYSFLAHMINGISKLHEAGYAYGCLSPRMIFVTTEGRIRMANYACACIAQKYLPEDDRKAYFTNDFIAPEVRQSPDNASPASDVYSLALLFTELVSGISLRDFEGSADAFVSRLPGVSTKVKEALSDAIKADPSERTQDVLRFKDILKEAVEAPNDNELSSIVVGVNDLRALLESTDLPVLDLGSSDQHRKPDLFDSSVSRATSRSMRTEVWIYQKDGMDYGPFDHKGLMQKFYDDEITESTSVFNSSTKKSQNLGSIEEFAEEVQKYIPVREHNRAEREAERRRKEKQMKAAGFGTAALIIIGIAVVFTLPVIYFALKPAPQAMNLQDAFIPFEKKFEMPKIEAVSLNVDQSKAKALFDPKATEAEREAALKAWEEEHRKKYANRKRPGGAKKVTGDSGEEIETIVFTGDDGEELEPLEDWEIEEQAMSARMLRKVRECYAQHAGGRQIEAKINFVINQTGTLRSVNTSLGSGDLDACLVSAFSTMKFRPFGGTVKKVTIPVGY